jgi:hypothetical protein
MFAFRLKFEIMFVLKNPGHDEVKKNWRAQADKTQVYKTKAYFVGADA